MAAEMIHDVGTTPTVALRNEDSGGSAHWVLDWQAGRWLLATFDG
jgi:hypothetical protein